VYIFYLKEVNVYIGAGSAAFGGKRIPRAYKECINQNP
jgi:hypothetical protein